MIPPPSASILENGVAQLLLLLLASTLLNFSAWEAGEALKCPQNILI
jgi:hypothetical protein